MQCSIRETPPKKSHAPNTQPSSLVSLSSMLMPLPHAASSILIVAQDIGLFFISKYW